MVSRVVAYIIDGFIVGILASISATLLGLNSTFGAGGIEDLIADFDVSVLTVAVGLLYFVGSWSGGRRATLGQRLFQIQVGNAFDGRPLTVEQAVRRWLGYGQFLTLFTFDVSIAGVAGVLQFAWFIALLVSTATSPTRQGLHDRLANTAVVRPTTAGRTVAVTCLVIIVALVVIAVVGTLVFLLSVDGQEILRRMMEQV